MSASIGSLGINYPMFLGVSTPITQGSLIVSSVQRITVLNDHTERFHQPKTMNQR